MKSFLSKNIVGLSILIIMLFFNIRNLQKVDPNLKKLNEQQIELLNLFDEVSKNINNLKAKEDLYDTKLDDIRGYIAANDSIQDEDYQNLKSLLKTQLNTFGEIIADIEVTTKYEFDYSDLDSNLVKIIKDNINNSDSEGLFKLNEKIYADGSEKSYMILQGAIDLKNLKFYGGYKYNSELYHKTEKSRESIFDDYKTTVSVWSADPNMKVNLDAITIEHDMKRFGLTGGINYGVTYDPSSGRFVVGPSVSVGINYIFATF